MTVYIRSQSVKDLDKGAGFSDPWVAPFISRSRLPREGEQIVTGDDRAFLVTLVEHHYKGTSFHHEDLETVHLFCIEFPREKAPEFSQALREDLRRG